MVYIRSTSNRHPQREAIHFRAYPRRYDSTLGSRQILIKYTEGIDCMLTVLLKSNTETKACQALCVCVRMIWQQRGDAGNHGKLQRLPIELTANVEK